MESACVCQDQDMMESGEGRSLWNCGIRKDSEAKIGERLEKKNVVRNIINIYLNLKNVQFMNIRYITRRDY